MFKGVIEFVYLVVLSTAKNEENPDANTVIGPVVMEMKTEKK